MTTQVTARRFRRASPVTAGTLAVLVVLLAGASVPLYAVTHQNGWWTGGSTGHDMTPIQPSRHPPAACRTPWT